jgi:hypothetical protein
LLETTRVEYGALGEEISLPPPLNFSLITTIWPRWK